jgi:hypothetical protein
MFAAGFARGWRWPWRCGPRTTHVRWPCAGAAALLAALAAVSAEALWRPRRWAYRASAALALAHTAAALAGCIMLFGLDGIGMAGAYLFFSGFVVVPIMVTVHEDAAALVGAAGVRVAARRPPP